MKGKKAQLDQHGSLIARIVVVIVAFTLIMLIVVGPAIGIFTGGFGDGLCRTNVALRNSFPFGAKGLVGLDHFCGSTDIKVYADDWKKCPEAYKEEFKAAPTENEEIRALKKCAAYQIVKLADRCWYMGGGSDVNLGSEDRFDCFDVTVRDIGEDKKINLKDDILPARKDVKAADELKNKIPDNKITFPDNDQQHITEGKTARIYFCYGGKVREVSFFDCED